MSIKKNLNLFKCLSIILFISFKTYGQENFESRVDSLFSDWNNSKTPGYSVGIIKDNQLVYAKGYGIANLEYNIPLSPTSAFYIGSMSKQFTAACLLMLQEQGKLKITDDIRKYLPGFPKYQNIVTIKNLLHHTSGIKEAYSLMLFRGDNPRFENNFDNDDVFKLLCQQSELDFLPNEQYRYSSGGYILLTKIIERVSGKSLRAFSEEYIFKPLEMNHTFFNENYAEIIPNRVESYRPTSNGFERFNKNFNTYGDGGLITTVEDLVKWDHAFYEDKLGIKDFSKKMYTQGVLNNGDIIDYAWALQIREYNGRKCIEHNGGMLGFAVDMVRFPDEKFTAIVLSNSWKIHPTAMAYKLADIYLGNNSNVKDNIKQGIKSLKLSSNELKNYVGHYWNIQKNYYNRIDYQNDTLFFDNADGWRVPLVCIQKDSFQIAETDLKVKFFVKNGKQQMTLILPKSNTTAEKFEKFNSEPPKIITDLKKYVGPYHSKELKTTYTFAIDKNKLTWQIDDLPEKQIFPQIGSVVWNSKNMVWIGFGEIIFQVDTQNKITGLTIGDNRVTSVFFTKIDTSSN